jgi:hypothetical protein
VRVNRLLGSMSGVWKRSYGNATKALPDERGGRTDMRFLRSPRHISTRQTLCLVAEDDEKIASFIVNGLKQSGFAVDKASDGEEDHGRAGKDSRAAARPLSLRGCRKH